MLATSETPKPTLVTSLQNIMQLPVERNCDYGVYAYVINKDIINEKGEVDDLRAMIFHLGSFYDEEKASNHAKNIIEKTGYSRIKVVQYGFPAEITVKPDPDIIQTINVDMKGKIIKMENEEYERQKEIYEKRIQFEKDMLKECEDEINVHHLEHYKRAAYLVTKHYICYLELKKRTEEMYKNYELKKKALQEHYKLHPEHEEQFLPFLKEKLLSRNEDDLYYKIEAGYNEYKDLFLS